MAGASLDLTGKRRKLEPSGKQVMPGRIIEKAHEIAGMDSTESSALAGPQNQIKLPPNSMTDADRRLSIVCSPSLERFWSSFMQKCEPVVLQGQIL